MVWGQGRMYAAGNRQANSEGSSGARAGKGFTNAHFVLLSTNGMLFWMHPIPKPRFPGTPETYFLE